MERYARQSVFTPIGKEGQAKLLRSKVTIIGMGALGTVAANNLCRAGVGCLRIIDRDYVELTNLQRQTLYNEEDAHQNLPKVIAASKHLSMINSEIDLEPIIADVNASNIEDFICGSDLVIDANDNMEIRFIINEACHKHKIPWIYCGALGAHGVTMNILPGINQPCLRCFIGESGDLSHDSCSTVGVLNMLTGMMASIQSAEAIKILISSDSIRSKLLTINLWENRFNTLELGKDDNCPVCVHKNYELLGGARGSNTTSLCGSDSIQIIPPKVVKADFEILAKKLEKIGNVRFSEHILAFSDSKYEIKLFQDGRAIIKNAIDANNAKSVYTEYIGL